MEEKANASISLINRLSDFIFISFISIMIVVMYLSLMVVNMFC